MPIDISIIIINYNVQAFLEQCLYSVYKASKELNVEVIVVDNNSVDDSIAMLKKNFPEAKLICNHENKGFAGACNQGLKICKGKYALLLNPDTIIREDSLYQCYNFMNNHPDAGALGVKMIDGKGKFLPESKRSVPTASSAFYKMFGLSSIFPKSKIFGKYQLKYLDENKLHQVEVLSGAFMFLKMELLKKIGFLDEDYFMYGEDIDLSYRIIKAGYKNYYFPFTTIIHFKGESTKKASIKYVKVFYNAMLIFATKHYKGRHSVVFSIIINFAIYFRAAISLIFRLIKAIYLPIFDFILTWLLYSKLVPIWESYKFLGNKAYSEINIQIYILTYISIWLIFTGSLNGFRLFTKISTVFKAIAIGTIFILAGYSLLPESYRFSRAIILIGALTCFVSILMNRILFRFIANKGKGISNTRKKGALLVGKKDNPEFVNYNIYLDKEYDIRKKLELDNSEENNHIHVKQILDIIDVYKIEALVFFIKELPVSNLISTIIQTRNQNLEFKMVLPLSQSIVGPRSVINMETLPDFRINPITKVQNKIKKRFLDLLVSLIFLLLTPVFISKNNLKKYLSIIFKITINQLSWVSYIPYNNSKAEELPIIKPGVFSPSVLHNHAHLNDYSKFEENLNYAKNYKTITDIKIIYLSINQSFDLNYHINLNKQK